MRKLLPYVLPFMVTAALLLGGWKWLEYYTRHGSAVEIPVLEGLSGAEATARLNSLGLRAEVIDSVYLDEVPKGSVVDQDPDAGIAVKAGRKIYLVLNATQPKMLNMPRLVDLSKRQALSVLDILGLRVEGLRYKPDACVDCVVEQLYKGVPIEPETRIRRGDAITLVLGSGQGGERVPVPELTGWTVGEVQAILNMASLNLGLVVECRGCNNKADSAFARVFRQSPLPGMNNRIPLGTSIDIWVNADTTGLRPAPLPLDSAGQPIDPFTDEVP